MNVPLDAARTNGLLLVALDLSEIACLAAGLQLALLARARAGVFGRVAWGSITSETIYHAALASARIAAPANATAVFRTAHLGHRLSTFVSSGGNRRRVSASRGFLEGRVPDSQEASM